MFGVGRQAFVNSQGARNRPVILLDAASASTLGNMEDGTEVEILGWVPKGMATRYHVRSVKDGIDGWLGVSNLRATRSRPGPGGEAAKQSAPVSIPPRMPESSIPPAPEAPVAPTAAPARPNQRKKK